MSSTSTSIEQPASSAAVVTASRGGKYLAFALGSEHYGIEILKVREIIGHLNITRVPGLPAHVSGVINLRGQVISVLDLRSRLGLEPAPRTEQTCIVVVETRRRNGNGNKVIKMGLIVDRVLEVLNIPEPQITDSPEFGSGVDRTFLLGMGRIGDSVKILLDTDAILGNVA